MATSLHCAYCFDAVMEHCDQKVPLPKVELSTIKEKYPLFITWKKQTPHRSFFSSSSTHNWKLRGCIGTFTPKDLSTGLKEYAITSAFKDSRFSPLSSSEIQYLHVDVSFLLNFTPCATSTDWIIGTHGISLTYTTNNHTYTATYLPEVSREQGWTHTETLQELLVKSGYHGHVDSTLLSSSNLKVVRYESVKCGMSWQEYVKWKDERRKMKEEVDREVEEEVRAVVGSSSDGDGGGGFSLTRKTKSVKVKE